MSTRQSIYYDGPIHIWHELMDGRDYVSFNEDGLGNCYPVWPWVATALARVLRLTGRRERFEAEHKRQCEEYARTAPERDAARKRLFALLDQENK